MFQPEAARSDVAKRSSELDFWERFQPDPSGSELAKQSSQLFLLLGLGELVVA